jgi:hypothetical protein
VSRFDGSEILEDVEESEFTDVVVFFLGFGVDLQQLYPTCSCSWGASGHELA